MLNHNVLMKAGYQRMFIEVIYTTRHVDKGYMNIQGPQEGYTNKLLLKIESLLLMLNL